MHKTNRSKMATLIRNSYHGNMTFPALQGLEPLEMLAEIGLEKLQRDYQNTFIGEFCQDRTGSGLRLARSEWLRATFGKIGMA